MDLSEQATPIKMTKRQRERMMHDADIRSAAYDEGRRYELSKWQEHEKQYQEGMKRARLEQVNAVTALIKETTANLSKAGYLISQLNKEKGW